MTYVEVIDEKSRSRSGLHHRRVLFKVLSTKCEELKYVVVSAAEVKPTYAIGYAKKVKIRVPDDAIIMQLDFRKNIKGHILGDILIYDAYGRKLGRAVYRKLKVRLVEYIAPNLLELIKCVFHKLKLPVKRYGVIKH